MFRQRRARVPARARRRTYAWTGSGVGEEHDGAQPEKPHHAPSPEPADEDSEPARKRRLALIRSGRRGFGLPDELMDRCMAYLSTRDRLSVFGAASRSALRAAREARWFFRVASTLSRTLGAQLRSQAMLVNEQVALVAVDQAKVKHFSVCLGSLRRKLDDRQRELKAYQQRPLAAAVRRRALFSKRGARELVDVARAHLAADVVVAQPYDAYYDGVVTKEIAGLERSVGACDHQLQEATRRERRSSAVLVGVRVHATVLNGGCLVAKRLVEATEARARRR